MLFTGLDYRCRLIVNSHPKRDGKSLSEGNLPCLATELGGRSGGVKRAFADHFSRRGLTST